MTAGLASFHFEIGPLGYGKMTINDEDVTEKLTGVEFQARPGQPSLLTVHTMAANGVIEGEGIVQVAPPGSDVASLVGLLSTIDADWLSAEVLNRSGFGDNPMVVVLEVLKDWASGTHS